MRWMLGVLLMAAALAPAPARAQGEDAAVTIAGPSGELGGVMRRAGEGAPLLLIIPGSGPTDHNGDNRLGVRGGPYRRLAEALAAQGVSSVRIDKRGMFSSAAGAADPNAVTVDDYAADVRAWTAALRAREHVRCVWVLGHSEGGLVALAAAPSDANLCGLILLAAPGRKFGDVLRAQLAANPANAPLMEDAMRALDAFEHGRRIDVSAMHPALQGLFNPRVQGFLISLASADPVALLAHYAGPTLVVQGANDVQISPADDADKLAHAREGVDYAPIPGMNHVLRIVPDGDRAANLASYADANAPIAPALAPAIARFIAGHPAQ
ncbi:MAG TPA: alpha/beta fold hydrolase [Caulobacterales bacterium]|nr:alpha/beta fold hydrolase [Caulobacterales bacterium]